jgi:hypothetical protein
LWGWNPTCTIWILLVQSKKRRKTRITSTHVALKKGWRVLAATYNCAFDSFRDSSNLVLTSWLVRATFQVGVACVVKHFWSSARSELKRIQAIITFPKCDNEIRKIVLPIFQSVNKWGV